MLMKNIFLIQIYLRSIETTNDYEVRANQINNSVIYTLADSTSNEPYKLHYVSHPPRNNHYEENISRSNILLLRNKRKIYQWDWVSIAYAFNSWFANDSASIFESIYHSKLYSTERKSKVGMSSGWEFNPTNLVYADLNT